MPIHHSLNLRDENGVELNKLEY